MLKNKSSADIIAQEMDKLLQDEHFNKVTTSDFSAVLSGDATNKPFVREASEKEDLVVEEEVNDCDDNNAEDDKEVYASEVKNMIESLLSLSEKLDNLGFVKSSINTALIVDYIIREAGGSDDDEQYIEMRKWLSDITEPSKEEEGNFFTIRPIVEDNELVLPIEDDEIEYEDIFSAKDSEEDLDLSADLDIIEKIESRIQELELAEKNIGTEEQHEFNDIVLAFNELEQWTKES